MGDFAWAVVQLLVVDVVFVLVASLVPLALINRAASAVLRRNFVGYFSNPTGYVFLCLFVFLTSVAAFWPHDFFNANLANLDQLNRYLPLIMLVFIPAITMSIWADERRQGTDELLLTLPADDFDIVIGKFLAAAAVFTASLLFSQICSCMFLASLSGGQLDVGLMLATYFGYWLMGLAMLSIGMVASFLTNNLTIGFVLGVALNLPLVFATYADVIFATFDWARLVATWSIARRAEDLGRGVVSLSSVAYFGLITAVGLYLSMVLIGRRHWSGGRDGHSMWLHFLLRSVALIVIMLAATYLFVNHDLVRWDVTKGKISSLSKDTKRLVRSLRAPSSGEKKSGGKQVRVDAFISREVPEQYAKTKRDLVTLLREFEKASGGTVLVNLNDSLDVFSEEAVLAEERYGIKPQNVMTRTRGKLESDDVILGAAFTCGLEKVVVPFFDYGIPVEYELVRSIATVARGTKKKLGVVTTDARMMGGFLPSFQQAPRQAIIDELSKQYDIQEVNPAEPIPPDRYDVLLAVQPSSLGRMEMQHLVDAVKSGVPTAIFEDPQPNFFSVPATGQPRQPMGGGMFGGGAPQEKGDISELWSALAIKPPGSRGMMFQPDIVWQDYNPYPKLQRLGIPKTWVFVRREAPGAADAFGSDPITSQLDEVLLVMPGSILPDKDSQAGLTFTKLLSTGTQAGTVNWSKHQELSQSRDPAAPLSLDRLLQPMHEEQIVACRIQGPEQEGSDDDDSDEDSADKKPKKRPINAIYVADIDLMLGDFLRIRAQPDYEGINWKIENVSFLLNAIDVLSGDQDYVNIRNRKPQHATLSVVEAQVAKAHQEEEEEFKRIDRELNDKIDLLKEKNNEIIKGYQDVILELDTRQSKGEDVREQKKAKQTEAAIKTQLIQTQASIEEKRAQRKLNDELKRIQRKADLKIQKTQNNYKSWAVATSILPAIVGLVVFVQRRLREREGISKARLK